VFELTVKHFAADRRWLWTVSALMVMRLVMGWLLLNDIPRLPSHDGWYFRHGGDQALYFRLAQSIAAGQPQPSSVGIGQPLVIAALLRLTGAADYFAVLPWLVVLHGFVYAGLSVWALAIISRAFTASRPQSLVTATIWTFSGYLLWLGLGLHWDAENLRDAYLTRQLWMEGMTDPPSLFLTMTGIAVIALIESARRSGEPASAYHKWFLVSGLAFGLAGTVRIHTLAASGAVLLALLLARGFRRERLNLVWVGVGFLLGLSPQIIYTFAAEGEAFTIGGFNIPYIGGWFSFESTSGFNFNWRGLPFSPRFLLDSLILLTQRSWLLALAGVAAVCLAAYAFVACWRRCGRAAALIMFGAPLASLGLHITTYIFKSDPIRFSLPALAIGLPAAVWTAFAVVELMVGVVKREKKGSLISLLPQSKKGNF
jgi:hypothetical protein